MNKAIFIAFMLLFAVAVNAEDATTPSDSKTATPTNEATPTETTAKETDTKAKETTPTDSTAKETDTKAKETTTPVADGSKATTPVEGEDLDDKCFQMAHGRNVQEYLNTCKDTAAACGADIKKMCLTPKSHEFSAVPIMRCMKHNWSKVSSTCKDFVAKKMEASFQKKMPTCYKEISTLCKDTTGFMRFRCIKQHHDQLSEACKTEMKNAMMKRLGKCATDYTKFCANVRPGHRRVKACLRRNRHKLSADCQEQMCSPIFGQCCQDIRKHCTKMAKLADGHKQDDDDEFEDSVKPVDAPVKHWRGRRHFGHGKRHGKPQHGKPHHGKPHHGKPHHGPRPPHHMRPSPAQMFHKRHQFITRCLADNLSKLSAKCVAQQKANEGHFELPGAVQEEQNDHEYDQENTTGDLPEFTHRNAAGPIIALLIVMGVISTLLFCCCRCIRRRKCCKKGQACAYPGNQQYSQVPSDSVDVEMQPVQNTATVTATPATTTTVTAVPVSKASVPVATVTAVPVHSQNANMNMNMNIQGQKMAPPTMVVGQYYPVMQNGQQQQYAGAQPVVYRQ
eukprot:TRINITY_DN47_c0_g1_i6.p1 TRINITY_DN47_c0_g1~~TRINITY_DN47_c0_g1_i6.p1  ORF type:complete len:563 (+),score=151.65 TRINITY_DN47_c0_g1_i6:506-2194(+)